MDSQVITNFATNHPHPPPPPPLLCFPVIRFRHSLVSQNFPTLTGSRRLLVAKMLLLQYLASFFLKTEASRKLMMFIWLNKSLLIFVDAKRSLCDSPHLDPACRRLNGVLLSFYINKVNRFMISFEFMIEGLWSGGIGSRMKNI